MVLYESVRELLIVMQSGTVRSVAVQGVNLGAISDSVLAVKWQDCLFLGCEMPGELVCYLQADNYIFPRLDMPFRTYPNTLYSGESLYDGYVCGDPDSYDACYDKRVYEYYVQSLKTLSIKDSLAQALHDHSITENLNDFLSPYPVHRLVAIMGGHGLGRTDAMYRQVVLLSKSLTELGYLMLSGGGPGAMEATHLGAWLAGRAESDVDKALDVLKAAPLFKDAGWLDTALEVIRRLPCADYRSLGIPTWHYGHELATPFATDIAKYFANSIREEGLLALAKGGVIFSPGSAGTMQEIFQDLAQNHYVSYEMSSPMIFLGKRYWSEERPIYPLLVDMVEAGKLNHIILSITDDNADVISSIREFTKGQE
ncbi:LOG family protein [Porphyromonas sp.]|uniref:LOG family protein n=1 Tax=Porphyromonas sp. TaxID=1924944 RepID=UPI0026DBF8EF|nr:hypothetical protein [Porphyromonas sp.]MDO4695881.1 hypothetical protein [Porphyromonas sp.]MDO4770777.1 hypothetical protein [Porphyromonas sp.]